MTKAIILRAPGTNCDLETEFAFQRAGATTERVHIHRWIAGAAEVADAQILCIPGGFSYGDDIAAGRILAGQIRHYLADVLHEFCQKGKLILGICNGFQVLIQTGMLLPNNFGANAQATLTTNDSGKFEDRWVYLHVPANHSVFLRDIQSMYLPVAHAEGKFVTRTPLIFDELSRLQQLVLRYQVAPRSPNNGHVPYPANPNGSQGDVAGISDTTGRVFGLMPHPERFIDRVQHPRWTREDLPPVGDGLQIFQNAVDYFA